MGWGTSWDKKPVEWPKETIEELLKETPVFAGIDLGGDSQTVLTTFEDGKLKHRIIPKEELLVKPFTQTEEVTYNYIGNGPILNYAGTVDLPQEEEATKHQFKNKIPTHDPYTNPGAFLYYECECGQILDPKTKRFAELNNHASNVGWKIRWGSQSYIPYCVECAKEKGIE